jgi:hypothetical protein
MGIKMSASLTGHILLPKNIFVSVSGTHFCYRLSKPQSLMQMEGLGKLIKISHLIGSQTHDLPACSIVP